jgi:hypothetical protein
VLHPTEITVELSSFFDANFVFFLTRIEYNVCVGRTQSKVTMMNRLGQRVKIMAGMTEFVGKLGTIVDVEQGRPPMYRVRLDQPVEIPYVGLVRDDLWEGKLLRRIAK